jgi:hypothetical protein
MRKGFLAGLTAVVVGAPFVVFGGPSGAATAIPELSVTASANGGVTAVENGSGHFVSLQFTLNNHGPGPTSAEQDAQLILKSVTGATVVDGYCVASSHMAYNGDGPNCETVLKARESVTLIITVVPTTNSTITACYYSGGGIADPKPANDCATLSITVV